jgi:hypothetical protein
MPKIMSFVRAATAVEVVTKERDGKIALRKFPKTLTDAQIRAHILGEVLPEVPRKDVPEKAKAPVKTVPDPVLVVKERVTRQQMIDALEAANVTDYDPMNPQSLRSAYDALKAKGKSK